jgi:hypothetical protein
MKRMLRCHLVVSQPMEGHILLVLQVYNNQLNKGLKNKICTCQGGN